MATPPLPAVRGPGPGARGPPLPRRRHGGAAGAVLRAGGRAGPVPLLLLPRGRPRLCRHRLCDRRAGGLGRGARRPPAAGPRAAGRDGPAGGRRREAQGSPAAWGRFPEPAGRQGHAAAARGGRTQHPSSLQAA